MLPGGREVTRTKSMKESINPSTIAGGDSELRTVSVEPSLDGGDDMRTLSLAPSLEGTETLDHITLAISR
ncbi:unnamed protein product [Darwinula stevensoni]|uniref:Uncharacterized protein n=1 Tax=Darwinula stevensoni TaxID=69355 RepID=A0A7R9A9E4_9CRUS|nr:unnamed protein product [Darwinula stevensoni]CAG0897345.1 unnamed protein product [Darwinula stevensoni]